MALGGYRPGSGRKPGSRNKRSDDAEAFATRILGHEGVEAKILEQALNGTLPSVVVVTLLHYRYGKPVERVHHSGDADAPLVIQMVDFREKAEE